MQSIKKSDFCWIDLLTLIINEFLYLKRKGCINRYLTCTNLNEKLAYTVFPITNSVILFITVQFNIVKDTQSYAPTQLYHEPCFIGFEFYLSLSLIHLSKLGFISSKKLSSNIIILLAIGSFFNSNFYPKYY